MKVVIGMKEKLKRMLSENRYTHSVGVSETAVELAKIYGEDADKAYIAGLLHDCAKNIEYDNINTLCNDYGLELTDVEKASPALVHAPLGVKIARTEFGIEDEYILDAIKYHTVGRAGMTLLDKIVYLADVIEPGRDFENIDEMRRTAKEDLDTAVLYALDMSLIYNIEKGNLLHPNSTYARNDLLGRVMNKNGFYMPIQF